MAGQTFGAEDFDELPDEIKNAPAVVDEGGDPPSPQGTVPPAPAGFKVPDDFEIEELRGASTEELLRYAKGMREMTQTIIGTMRQQQPAPVAPAAPAGPRPEDYQLTSEDLLGTDPSKVNQKLDQFFAAKAGPLLVETYQTMSQQNYMLAKQDKRNMPYFDDYENEIIALARTQSVDRTANMATWYQLYNTVVMRHSNDIIQKEVEKRTTRPAPPMMESGRGGSRGGQQATLTDDERSMARALGVSEQEYLHYKNR